MRFSLMRHKRNSGPAERIDRGSPWWGEHMARYRFAVERVRGKTVLDVACGTGYGLAALQAMAKWVVGVDLDPSAVQCARLELHPGGGEVILADATRIPFEDGHFDAVTSFETLEHLPKRTEFLSEISRVLAPSGELLISTPNARYTRPIDGRPRNPYHLHEYEPDELVAALHEHFHKVELIGQKLDARFVVPPFDWDLRDVRDPFIRANAFVRKVIFRLPEKARDPTSWLLWGHSFFPKECDYHFSPIGVEEAGVLVAICTEPRRREGR
jgi:2-polyprenyl-3-methyl-5-hydroxy-6-metoxy-1,4-benzoquinol methylase